MAPTASAATGRATATAWSGAAASPPTGPARPHPAASTPVRADAATAGPGAVLLPRRGDGTGRTARPSTARLWTPAQPNARTPFIPWQEKIPWQHFLTAKSY